MKSLHLCVYLRKRQRAAAKVCACVSFCFCMGAQRDNGAIESLPETPVTSNSSYFQSSLVLITDSCFTQNSVNI